MLDILLLHQLATISSIHPEVVIVKGFPFKANKEVNLPELLMKIATKGSEEYNKVFNTNQTQEQKAQKEVLDMLA